MMLPVIADTGPLVAFLDRSDQHHEWAAGCMERFFEPLFTCDAVLAESVFLLQRGGISVKPLFELLRRGILQVHFDSSEEMEVVARLIERYRNLPMSFADACLVRMSEMHAESTIWTIDSHFGIYRRHRRNVIVRISPGQ
jgi:predicted nucleic acid-binding protein